jgi:transposase InsO family protein
LGISFAGSFFRDSCSGSEEAADAMVTKRQLIRLFKEFSKKGNMTHSAMKADLDPKTAAKYINENCQSPEELQVKHRWRTRLDPLASIWDKAVQMLEDAPELESTTLLEHFLVQTETGLNATHLRTFQRRVKQWRLTHGPDKEVFFPQTRMPGRMMQLDWTHALELNVSIQNRTYDHLLCHVVLPYSNWQWATRCHSESLLSLRAGLQEALFRLGRVPPLFQVDNSSAATHQISTGQERAFNGDFLSIMEHFGLKPVTINIGCPNENGDVESLNGHLKRRIKQYLILRGSRDFSSTGEYDLFLEGMCLRANETRQTKVAEELVLMRELPPTRLNEYDEVFCRVSSQSTIRVKKVGYSVPARWIGQQLKVEVYEAHLQIYAGRELLLQLPRERGDRGAVIDFRHVIEQLLRKPGAFAEYRYREELFPSPTYRRAYDRLNADHGERAGEREYLHLLKLTADLSVDLPLALAGNGLEAALSECLGDSAKFRVESLRRLLGMPSKTPVPEMELKPDLSGYDSLLEGSEVAHAA